MTAEEYPDLAPQPPPRSQGVLRAAESELFGTIVT